MQTVSNLVKTWAEEQNVVLSGVEERLIFTIDGKNGSFPAMAVPVENERLLVIICGVSVFVPKEKMDEVAIGLVELNFSLNYGAFELNREQGEITLRTAGFLPEDAEEANKMISKAIVATGLVMDSSLHNILKMVTK